MDNSGADPGGGPFFIKEKPRMRAMYTITVTHELA